MSRKLVVRPLTAHSINSIYSQILRHLVKYPQGTPVLSLVTAGSVNYSHCPSARWRIKYTIDGYQIILNEMLSEANNTMRIKRLFYKYDQPDRYYLVEFRERILTEIL